MEARDVSAVPRSRSLDRQRAAWDYIALVYTRELEPRVNPVLQTILKRARLAPSERVLEIGCGAGALAIQAAEAVGPLGQVLAIDISEEMLRLGRQRAVEEGVQNVRFENACAEALAARDGSVDVVLASLSLMFVQDRPAAAREIARVLAPKGRLVAAVLAGPEECDLVKFQKIAGSFLPEPPPRNVGPGSMADPSEFLAQLSVAGMPARVEREPFTFEFPNLETAWQVLAGVVSTRMSSGQQAAAQDEIANLMWPEPAGSHEFQNMALYLVGYKQ
jgi:SAM-dependent methyltransferase